MERNGLLLRVPDTMRRPQRRSPARNMGRDRPRICTWTIPGRRTKIGEPHRVPLSTGALAVLGKARELSDRSGLVFPSVTSQALSDSTISKLCRENGVEGTPHGMRSAFRSWAAETGADWAVAELCLDHRAGSDVELAYQRSDLLERRRELMETWAQYLNLDASTGFATGHNGTPLRPKDRVKPQVTTGLRGGGLGGITPEGHPLLYPLGEGMFVHMSARYRKHRLFGVVDIRRIRIPPSVVEVHKDDQRGPSSTLVPVRQRMVTNEAVAEHSCLRNEIRVKLLASEGPPSERVKRNRRVRSALAALVSLWKRL